MASRSTRRGLLGTVAVSAIVLVLGAAPFVSFGADHLDAPGLTPPSGRADADINDVYAFQGSNEANTVLVMTTHPAAGAIAPLEYATDVTYQLKIDDDGNARPDIAYRIRFGAPRTNGDQRYRVVRVNMETHQQHAVASGLTGNVNPMAGGGKAFAGLRSDPFFFDLDAFRGVVLGQNDREFCDSGATDFFESLNTNAIVLEVPDSKIGGNIGVWATTGGRDGRIDRKGRPAINTVFNSGEDKNLFNQTGPAGDLGRFGDNVVNVLLAFSALDPDDGAYSPSEAETLAGVLLPDLLTYDTSTDAAGPLNGRALADDVIDAELNIVTGGFPFAGRDGVGGIPSDCVGPHDDYTNTFPYLGSRTDRTGWLLEGGHRPPSSPGAEVEVTGRSAKTMAAVLMISIGAAAFSSAVFRPPNSPREGRILGAAAGEAIPPSSRPAIAQAPGRPHLGELERLIRAFSAQTDETPNATGLAFLGRLELERARLTGDIGSFTRAERALNDAHRLAPRDGEVATLLATVRFTTHDFTGALDLADVVYSAQRDPGALAVRADARLELGRYTAAATDYRTLSSLLPGSAGVLSRTARLAFLQGRAADADRLAAGAEAAARREGAFGATLAWYGSFRGRLALDAGRYDEAARHYRRAVRLAPDYHVAIGGLAAVRSAQDRYDEAIRLFERAVRFVPEPQYLASLGDLYTLRGRDDLAEARYGTVETIATLARANRQLYDRQLALFYADHDLHPDDALAIAQQSLETRKDVYGYDAVAWALYRLGRHDEARAASTRALALGTPDARLWYHAGMISIALGDDDLAAEQLTKALRLSPSFDPVQSAVARDALAGLEAGR